MKRLLAYMLAGSVLMAWGGESIASKLNLSGFGTLNVAAFAIGIALLALAPQSMLAERIRRLEATLKMGTRDRAV